MFKAPKIDLTLLNSLVAELATTLEKATAENAAAISAETEIQQKIDTNQYIVELAKAVGLTTGITMEASLLAVDIQGVAKAASNPVLKDDSFDSLLSLLKTPSKTDGTNKN